MSKSIFQGINWTNVGLVSVVVLFLFWNGRTEGWAGKCDESPTKGKKSSCGAGKTATTPPPTDNWGCVLKTKEFNDQLTCYDAEIPTKAAADTHETCKFVKGGGKTTCVFVAASATVAAHCTGGGSCAVSGSGCTGTGATVPAKCTGGGSCAVDGAGCTGTGIVKKKGCQNILKTERLANSACNDLDEKSCTKNFCKYVKYEDHCCDATKTCTCDNGTPAKVTACPGGTKCTACNSGYQLSGNKCTECADKDTDFIRRYKMNECTAKNGTDDDCVSGHKYDSGTKKCLECKDGYTKDGEACIADCSGFLETLTCESDTKESDCKKMTKCKYENGKCVAKGGKDKQCKTSVVVVVGIVGGIFLLIAVAVFMKKKN